MFLVDIMTTWAGAIVESGGRPDFSSVAAKHRITLSGELKPWVLVQADVRLHPPVFAEALSRELRGTVIAFFVQTTASVEQVEQWDSGELVRKLGYSADEGGWITQSGTQQEWESTYFFADNEGTRDGESWPLNLPDDLTTDDIARFEQARATKDASRVMDLLSGGAVWPLRRLCARFGLDPEKPCARYTPPRNWRPWIIATAILAFFAAAFLLGALTAK